MSRLVLAGCANSVIVSSSIVILLTLIAPVSSDLLRIRGARSNAEPLADDYTGRSPPDELAEPFTVCLTTSVANPRPETVAECDIGLHRIDSTDFVDIPVPADSATNWTLIIRPDDDSWTYNQTNPTADQSKYFHYVVIDSPFHAQVTSGGNGTDLSPWPDASRSILSFGFTDMADMIGITMDVLYAITVSLFYGLGVLRALKYLFFFFNFIG